MISRRATTSLVPLALASLAASPVLAAPTLGEDGLYVQPWFLHSFLDIGEDLANAAGEGKRLAVMWELRGCPYCKELHLTNFADGAVEAYVRANFQVLQLNLLGSRLVTDLDGEKLSEKALAAKYAVRFAPTIQFFPQSADGLGALAPGKREAARMPGFLKRGEFLAMFRFVRERGYEGKSFSDWLKTGT